MKRSRVRHCLSLVYAVVLLSISPIDCDYNAITLEFGAEAVDHCIKKCPFQNRTDSGQFEIGCGTECNIEQCSTGCRLWEKGLDMPCQAVCNVTTEVASPKELYCVMGCNEALNHYFQKLKDAIGSPPAPALVADSLTATSLSLEWEGSKFSNLSYLVQWRYEEVAGAWQYCRNQTWGQYSTVKVDNLQPYTKYRFRIAILLSSRHGDPIVSQPSVVISTLPAGPPKSVPVSLRVTAIDPHRISLSWEPGQFPNGPILSYVLRISDGTSNGYSALKDIPASENTLFYMFQNLAPATTYSVAVAMRNGEGEGPRVTVQVSTPAMPAVVANQQPVLILGGQYTVLQQACDMLLEPTVLYVTEDVITGIGLDLTANLLFVSESSGSVYRSSLSSQKDVKAILTPATIPYKPLRLSVDWLNSHLYILGEMLYHNNNKEWGGNSTFEHWQVVRCDFEGKGQTIAFAGFTSKPVHIEVDPYNGYLFWVLQGASHGGLYRLDLADISNGVKHEKTPEYILRDGHLGAFTVDHTNFRVLVSHLRRNTVLSVSLDGREVIDFRNNTQKPMFNLVQSLAFANGLFYWTNGYVILTEEYHEGQDSYFHNPYLTDTLLSTVLVALRSCQPIPVAVNPPIGVQSVMGINHAKITWQPPHLLGHQGNGAWQQWQYHLQITDVTQNFTIHRTGINSTSALTVHDLKENTQYIIKAAAFTMSGSGPWSTEFVGKTLLSQYIRRSSLLWSTKAGLFQTNLTGDNMQMLVHKDHLREGFITDISWYHDMLYLVTNASTVLWYNSTSIQSGWMTNMENVGSLAVDWIGKNIYWSNPKQQLITRANLRGENREPVPIVTVAKELKIDALEGYIYWNTGHAVESARLNGENKITYYPAQFFSGKQVMGLTVDLENKWLYWLVRGFEGSNLYKAPTAENVANGEKISGSPLFSLSGTSTLGPLCYFSERLVWLQDESNAVISDLTGINRAILNGSNMAGVNMIAIVDPLLHSNSEQINPIPEAVDSKSIVILGHWDAFNITWKSVQSVNHGTVFYDLNVEINKRQEKQYTVTEPYFTYNSGDLPPYSILEVSVRAYTYWGGSPVARSQLHTPESPPTYPTNARAYVEHTIDIFRNQQQTSVIFRWDPPTHANGIIQKYRVFKWDAEGGTDNNVNRGELLQPHVMQYVAKNLRKNVTYYFQVQACTSAGYGPLSRRISITTDFENPIPKLIISTHDAIIITDLDLGTAATYTVARSTGRPLDFTVSMQENAIYWVNELNEIFISHIDETGYIKLTSLNGTVTTLTYDWIARMLYWSQMDTELYTIYKMDLNYHDSDNILKITSVLSRPNQIQNLQISPLTRSLYWVEPAQDGHGKTLMTSSNEGKNVRPFFGQNDDSDGECDCPDRPAIAQTYIIDFRKNNQNKLYWVDAWTNHIVVSDINGCSCTILVNATRLRNYGLPPTSISVDSKNMFWLNSTQKRLYMTDKQVVKNIFHTSSSSGYKILALGYKSQPYPRKECLSPKQNSMLQVSMAKRTSDSMNLALPPLEKHRLCKDVDVEMATPQYLLHYRPYIDNDSTYSNDSLSKTVKTFEREIHLSNLRPFTKYSFQLQVTNYYGRLQEIAPTMGPVVILRTSAGAPGMAKNLNASVISPSTAVVQWQAPDYDPHSDEVWYEVHWRTGDSESSGKKLKEHNTIVTKPAKTINIPQAELERLLPDQLYVVWVRTYSNNSDVSTDSDTVHIVTYPEPNNITLIKPTAYNLHIAWQPYRSIRVVQYNIEYSELGMENWSLVKDKGVNKSDGFIHHLVDELSPKTQYKFRMQLQYLQNTSLYTWPQDARFTYETLGDRPSPPGRPHVQHVSFSVYQLQWAASAPHGSSVTLYRLWGAQHTGRNGNNISSNVTIYTDNDNQANDFDYYVETRENVTYKDGNMLVLLYNGTENYWIIANLQLDECYTFYVQALNSFGWSDYSEPSEEFDFAESNVLAAQQEHMSIILGVGIPVLATFAFSLLVALICLIQKRGKKKTLLDNPNALHNAPRGLDVELATLRELPRTRGGNFQHSTNILYNNGVPHMPTDAEISMLPHIRRDQITLKKFLGSGAFGEVFEGTAKNLGSRSVETKVAIKTLRKGASEQEKTEFLQEAQLMSNFKHDHILSLLGVCLDNNPNFIIMELMEGGDLLSYLRSKRNLLYTPNSLMLTDLLSMCLDVTRGCRYLEEMHFVHRDLACRNCLVSHKNSGRIVKIGDFGLARDIYKNDYYRKEGEGLLPVRWMAVECLVDGVFSSQSDVWAWGVLCWEVLSLGHQPYPGRTNHEVLAHVRQGGTPSRPPNCSHRFYELLQRCWSYNPDHRPTFKHCLEVVQELKDKTSPNISLTATTLAEAPQYLTILRDGSAITNRTYLMDENHNASLTDEDYPHDTQNMNGQFTPKYLEFLFNTEAPIAMTSDGYEIPRTTLQRHSSFRSTLPRHSIIGVNPNRLIRTPPNLLRSNSLKVQPSHKRILSTNGIVPFRNVMLRPLSLSYGDHMSGGSSTSCADRPVYKNIIGNKNMREMTLPTPMSVVGTSDSNLSELNKLLNHNKRSNSASDNEELNTELSQVENR